jgi:transposase-like protein
MYHGGFKKNFPLFMKEMEFRFNQRDNDNVVELLTKMLLEETFGPV